MALKTAPDTEMRSPALVNQGDVIVVRTLLGLINYAAEVWWKQIDGTTARFWISNSTMIDYDLNAQVEVIVV